MATRLETLDDTVSLQAADQQVHDPQGEEEDWGNDFGLLGAAELAADSGISSDHQHNDRD